MDEKFKIVGAELNQTVQKDYTDIPRWKDILYRFTRNKGSLIGAIAIVLVIAFAFLGPLLSPYTYDAVDTKRQNMPPRIPVVENLGIFDGYRNGVDVYEQKDCKDEYHYFGTDTLGRDLWARVCYGTRISLYIALVAVLIDMVIGITYGMVCGYFGGAVDIILQRIVEVINGIPQLVVVTLLMVILKPGLFTITLALLITSWIGMSRVVRAQVLQLKEQEYILASRTLGTPIPVILFKEILPNTMGQVIILAMMSVPSAIFTESFLSFVGLGIPAPLASLGSLISTGFDNILTYPYQVAIPVVIFSILMVSFNLTADGLRDAMDPRMWQ
ncbi:MAG: ABC transporter permease [Lachnospiraceae bacterium]|nr:ABC transporter permease [Lachnospiraceae bacterium]MCD8073970.1 ABC transporter permease [Lachnospiraceae bacterium]